MTHRTTDTERPAPYPDMTEDDLLDYEAWADSVESEGLFTLKLAGGCAALLLLMLLARALQLLTGG